MVGQNYFGEMQNQKIAQFYIMGYFIFPTQFNMGDNPTEHIVFLLSSSCCYSAQSPVCMCRMRSVGMFALSEEPNFTTLSCWFHVLSSSQKNAPKGLLLTRHHFIWITHVEQKQLLLWQANSSPFCPEESLYITSAYCYKRFGLEEYPVAGGPWGIWSS